MTSSIPQISIKSGIVILLVTVFVLYGFNRSKEFLTGPRLIIQTPVHGSTIVKMRLEITGTASNIAHLYLDDRQIFTDEKGVFKETLLLAPGFNIIEIRAIDRFNRTIRDTRSIYSVQ